MGKSSYLEQTHREARKIVGEANGIEARKGQIIDKLITSGSYINFPPKTTSEHKENESMEKYRIAIRWMTLIILGLVILDLLGVSSVWECFF